MDVVATAYGRPALVELHRLISAVKANDPLSPVSVLVPSNYVGVSTRRMLASGELGPIGTQPGIAGIDLLTTYRLAELFGAPRLAAQHRRPLSTPVIAAAVRNVLTSTDTMFAAVSEHPSTERALVRVHRELRDLTPAQLDHLAGQSQRAGEVVAIHKQAAASLATQWYDEFDLFDSATTVLATRPDLARERGRIIVYLPQQLTAAGVRLLVAAAEHTAVTVLAGFTGSPGADNLITGLLDRLGVGLEHPRVARTSGTHVVSVSDPDDEIRAVLRDITNAVLAGAPLESMAVLHGADNPYARLLDEQLEAAGIPRNGAAVRRVDESVVGRTVLALLELPDRHFRRTDVLGLLASAPIKAMPDDHALAPVNEWERISREAGIVEGVSEWRTRLDRFRRESLDDIERLGGDTEDPRVRRLHRLVRESHNLGQFVEELASATHPGSVPGSWTDKANWLRSLVGRYLGRENQRVDWPELEELAAEKLDDALDRLSGLDSVETTPSLATFRRALELELEGGLGRTGSFGEGVFVGRVGQALGVDLTHVFILGMAEGVMPGRHHDDSLLPDLERSTLGGALRLASARVDEDHRAFLAALSAGSETRRLYFPRGDLRRSSERMPSRWLLDTIEVLNGQRVWSDGLGALAQLGHPWINEIPSFVGGLRRVEFPASDQEYELRSLLDHHEHDRALTDHHLVHTDSRFRRGVELISSRNSDTFSRFDGNLTDVVTDQGVRIDVVSPTRLEDWAKCPHRYLMQNVLQVDVLQTPETLLQISALDRGRLVHDTLDRFLSELLNDGTNIPGPGESWPQELEDRLVKTALELCDGYEARGLVGKQLFWKRDREAIVADLIEMLRRDAERDHRGHLVASELGFGLPTSHTEAVTHRLGNEKTIRFRGSADRVERTSSGQLVVVDYKTGGFRDFAGIDKDTNDPVKFGTKLQLPVYALAARQAHGTGDDPVHAAYWFISTKGSFRWIGYDLDDRVMHRFNEVVETIVDGITAGLFPARPSKDHYQFYVECPYCDPDGLGTLGKRRDWERKRTADALLGYRQLAEPDELLDA